MSCQKSLGYILIYILINLIKINRDRLRSQMSNYASSLKFQGIKRERERESLIELTWQKRERERERESLFVSIVSLMDFRGTQN